MDWEPTAFLARPLRIIVVGAGISGIQFVKDATHRLKNVTITVYDKNDDIGGTWLENRYPGCSCDVPSHTYQYSWNPNPEWTQLYASAQEIHRYLQNTVDDFGLRKHFQFGTECVDAEWNEASCEWIVSTQNVHDRRTITRRKCDVFIYAVGRLNNMKMPDIEGLENFQGPILHTAAWPRDIQLDDKDVAVIGNGASAVQCIAVTRKVYNIVRNGTWLIPHVFSRNGEAQIDYTDEDFRQWKGDPASYLDFRYRLERQLAAGFAGLWLGSSSEAFTRVATQHMTSKIDDARTLAALVPEYPAGCRRTGRRTKWTWSCALQASTLTRRGSRSGDAGGLDLQELWTDQGGYESYMAATVAGFPNFFPFNPPICLVSGSAFPGIERTSDYIIRIISRLQTDNLKSIAVTHEAQTTFNRWVQGRMTSMVWSRSCSSWYKTGKGKVIVPWPGTVLHHYKATEIVRWEDFDLRFQDESMKYGSFGNGITSEGFAYKEIPWLHSQ
ncbi:hypothetical protein PG987_014071 [Apiospora arundinis]